MTFDFTDQIRNRAPSNHALDNQHEPKNQKKEFSHSNQYCNTERYANYRTVYTVGFINIAMCWKHAILPLN